MNSKTLSRRQAITLTGLGVGAALTAKPHIATAADAPGSDLSKTFSFCLNTATIRGQKLGFVKEV